MEILNNLVKEPNCQAPPKETGDGESRNVSDESTAILDIASSSSGNIIWAAWSSGGTELLEFLGLCNDVGISMAAPHVVGLAALIKQKFPLFSPSAIGSALSTTASLHDEDGGPIISQLAYGNPNLNQSPATLFDMGSGFVNATAASDPGLILDLRYEDYMSFLCGINGSAPVGLNYTGTDCGASKVGGAD